MIVPSGKRKYQATQGLCKNQSFFDDDVFERFKIRQKENKDRSPKNEEKYAHELEKIKEALSDSNSKNIKNAIAPNIEQKDEYVPEDLLGVPRKSTRPGMPMYKDRGSRFTRSIEPRSIERPRSIEQHAPEGEPIQPDTAVQPRTQPATEDKVPSVNLDESIRIKLEYAEKALRENPTLHTVDIDDDKVSLSQKDIEEQAKKPVSKQ